MKLNQNRPRRYEMDMCSGPILSKVFRFSLPLMATSILQLLFNAADIAVVGQFAGSNALSAVGATGALTNLIINLLMGLSIGTSVLVARYYGARQDRDVTETVRTSIAISLYGGVVVGLIGVFISKPMLGYMSTPADVIDDAALYMRIYFIGFPVIAVYNFGSAVLRAVGDTKRPLYFLTIAGVINVLLNLFCVIVLKMGVAGVALPTVISQAVAAGLVINALRHSESSIRLDLKKIRFDMGKVRQIVRIGLPAGIQGSIFSISNMVIQSGINSFGPVAMAGNTAASNLEGFASVIMNAFYQAGVTFTSQNLGAGKKERIWRIFLCCIGSVLFFGILSGLGLAFLGGNLLYIYTHDPAVIEYGILRLRWVGLLYCLCGLMDGMVGMMRGLGYSLLPMFVTLIGVVGVRMTWLFTVFATHHTLETLYVSYPISWGATSLVHILCFFVAYRRMMRAPKAAVSDPA